MALLFLLLWAANRWADEYQVRLLNNVAVFIILAVSYNLINGVCGQFHLGPNAFIALGAYTAALLTMTPAEKAINFLITPLYWPLSQIALPFPLALLAGGLVAALFGLLTGFPVFRVRGDYLAIVTLGFGEVVRVLANNVLVGCHCRRRASWWQAALRFPGYLREERDHLARGVALLEEVGLAEAAAEKAGQLPYGHQRRLEITRALATGPRLLLLDEPAAGLNPQETRELMDFLRFVHHQHRLTILVIEHNLRLVMGLCEQITVLDHGLTLAAGPPSEIRHDPAVIRAYLG